MIRSLSFRFAVLSAPFLAALLNGCGGEEKFADAGNNAANNAAAPQSTLAAPSGTPEAQVTEPPSKPGKYGGTLTDAVFSDPKTFNLWVAAEASSYGAVGGLYESLIARNPYTQQWEARLCELPKVSADNLTYTFTLKPNLKWSDGQPITADDIIFTLDAIYDEKVQNNMRESMMVDEPDGKGGFKRTPLKYRKIDARTVEFKFPVPYAPAREMLSFPPAPKHKLEAAYKAGQPTKTEFNSTWGVNVDVKELVASGTWVLASYVPGQRLVYNRNPNYWKKDKQGRQLPYLEHTVTLIVPDYNTVTLKFKSGETDFITNIQHTDFPSFKRDAAKGDYEVMNLGTSETTNFISFNMNPRSITAKRKPYLVKAFRDVRFRQAVAFAINRQRIADQVFLGLASPLYGPLTSSNKLYYNPNVAKYPYDVAKAKALLAQMGLKDSNGNGILEMDGQDLKFNMLTNASNNQRKIMAAIVTDDLKKVGLGASFTPMDANAMFGKMDIKPQAGKPYPPYNWESAMYAFGGGSVDPIGSRNIWSSSGNLHAWNPYQAKPDTKWEAEIDKIFREAAQQMDEGKRKQMYLRWQEIVAEQQPLIFTLAPDVLVAIRNRFGNLKPSNTAGAMWNVEEIYDLKATRDTP